MAKKLNVLEWVFRILLIIICICVILLSIPYWIYLSETDEAGSIATYVISAMLLYIVGGLGIAVGIFLPFKMLKSYTMLCAVMTVLSIVQIIIVAVSISDCDGDNSYIAIYCNRDVADGWFWFTTISLCACAFCALICDIVLWIVVKKKKDDPDNYY
ncbi:hypothetical protein QOT17_001891 [Balamuthia mandrillaris]